jgi:shikimate kinase
MQSRAASSVNTSMEEINKELKEIEERKKKLDEKEVSETKKEAVIYFIDGGHKLLRDLHLLREKLKASLIAEAAADALGNRIQTLFVSISKKLKLVVDRCIEQYMQPISEKLKSVVDRYIEQYMQPIKEEIVATNRPSVSPHPQKSLRQQKKLLGSNTKEKTDAIQDDIKVIFLLGKLCCERGVPLPLNEEEENGYLTIVGCLYTLSSDMAKYYAEQCYSHLGANKQPDKESPDCLSYFHQLNEKMTYLINLYKNTSPPKQLIDYKHNIEIITLLLDKTSKTSNLVPQSTANKATVIARCLITVCHQLNMFHSVQLNNVWKKRMISCVYYFIQSECQLENLINNLCYILDEGIRTIRLAKENNAEALIKNYETLTKNIAAAKYMPQGEPMFLVGDDQEDYKKIASLKDSNEPYQQLITHCKSMVLPHPTSIIVQDAYIRQLENLCQKLHDLALALLNQQKLPQQEQTLNNLNEIFTKFDQFISSYYTCTALKGSRVNSHILLIFSSACLKRYQTIPDKNDTYLAFGEDYLDQAVKYGTSKADEVFLQDLKDSAQRMREARKANSLTQKGLPNQSKTKKDGPYKILQNSVNQAANLREESNFQFDAAETIKRNLNEEFKQITEQFSKEILRRREWDTLNLVKNNKGPVVISGFGSVHALTTAPDEVIDEKMNAIQKDIILLKQLVEQSNATHAAWLKKEKDQFQDSCQKIQDKIKDITKSKEELKAKQKKIWAKPGSQEEKSLQQVQKNITAIEKILAKKNEQLAQLQNKINGILEGPCSISASKELLEERKNSLHLLEDEKDRRKVAPIVSEEIENEKTTHEEIGKEESKREKRLKINFEMLFHDIPNQDEVFAFLTQLFSNLRKNGLRPWLGGSFVERGYLIAYKHRIKNKENAKVLPINDIDAYVIFNHNDELTKVQEILTNSGCDLIPQQGQDQGASPLFYNYEKIFSYANDSKSYPGKLFDIALPNKNKHQFKVQITVGNSSYLDKSPKQCLPQEEGKAYLLKGKPFKRRHLRLKNNFYLSFVPNDFFELSIDAEQLYIKKFDFRLHRNKNFFLSKSVLLRICKSVDKEEHRFRQVHHPDAILSGCLLRLGANGSSKLDIKGVSPCVPVKEIVDYVNSQFQAIFEAGIENGNVRRCYKEIDTLASHPLGSAGTSLAKKFLTVFFKNLLLFFYKADVSVCRIDELAQEAVIKLEAMKKTHDQSPDRHNKNIADIKIMLHECANDVIKTLKPAKGNQASLYNNPFVLCAKRKPFSSNKLNIKTSQEKKVRRWSC